MIFTRLILLATLLTPACFAGDDKPFPRAQAIPLPEDQISFQLDGKEVLRYYCNPAVGRPYIYPLIGPAGRAVTRMGHPRDPHSHRHHLGLWIGQQNVDGANFWELSPKAGRIVHESIQKIDDGETAFVTTRVKWIDEQGKTLLLDERTWTFIPRYDKPGELFLDLELTLTPVAAKVVFGKTHFGPLAVRVAKTMGVNDGGGQIINSEGQSGEKEVLWQRARWCDYSGPAAPGGVINGITLFDHAENIRHPTYFHVRSDGWMGISLCHAEALEILKEAPLKLRYRFWVHDGPCSKQAVDEQWEKWAKKK